MDTKSKQTAVAVISPEVKAGYLDCLKKGQSLALAIATHQKKAVEDTLDEGESENVFAVARLVNSQLLFIATEAGYTEGYVTRLLQEASTANGYVKPTSTPRTGRKPEVIPSRCYRAAINVIEAETGRGVVPGKKFLANVAKLLGQFGREEISLADLKAKSIAADHASKPEAGKVVAMPKPLAKAA